MSGEPPISPPQPLRYEAHFETPEKDEAQTETDLNHTLRKIQQQTLADGSRPLRAVHAKSHALLRGELQVFADLPEPLAQGLFAQPAKYPLVMRFSTVPGDLLDDSVSTPRGVAIKIVGVRGARVAGSEDAVTQDFILINAPAFLKKDGKSFASALKLLAATTDKAPRLKTVLSAVLRGLENTLESVGGSSPTLISLGGQPEVHPLGDTYYSATPLLYGSYIAKISLAPVSPELLTLIRKPLDLRDQPDGLRAAMLAFFAEHGATWEVRAQLCTDLKTMPIEDASIVWPEEQSPYLPVARLIVPRQHAWSAARAQAIDEGLAFSPWHALSAHRPLGSVNRLRKQAYNMSRRFRAAHTQQTLEEPGNLDGIPD